ncbi:MAG: Mur ligase domain-containing protein, partial [Parcubacteria group bacterium]
MKSYDYYYLAKRNILPDADKRNRVVGTIEKSSRVHVSAVCGKAMASIACMLKEYGCSVTGSDVKFSPPMSDVLDSHGITRLAPSLENLENVDVLVVGNALGPDAPEVAGARDQKIPMISGAEAVSQIFSDKRAFVVTGTHGKTTTSALLTHVFTEAGKNPAYMIGGAFQKSNASYSMGNPSTNTLILEGDEYNCAFFDRAPKFLRYHPTSVILTSLEHDHIDLYP